MQINFIDNSKYYKDLKYSKINNSTRIIDKAGVKYIEFIPFDQFEWLRLAFSTRIGGVSKDFSSSMNFTYDRGDTKENVLENFNIFTKTIGTTTDRCVLSKQTHTTNVLKVDESFCGMGILRERSYTDIDGLITNSKNVCLVTAFADCVPVYFVDPVNKCIGASHSGWRGTAGNIVRETILKMKEEFGTESKDIHAFIGPSICMECYEVDEEVAKIFKSKYSENEVERVVRSKGNGKYLINLQMANYYNFINEGVLAENIGVSDLCTACNSDLLFSHRASKGQRGVLCGFMFIK